MLELSEKREKTKGLTSRKLVKYSQIFLEIFSSIFPIGFCYAELPENVKILMFLKREKCATIVLKAGAYSWSL